MRLKIIAILTGALILGAGTVGIIARTGYKDFNKDEKALDRFLVAIMYDELIDRELYFYENGDEESGRKALSEAGAVLAVSCEETSVFRYRSLIQKVSVKKVFKGEGIAEGEKIYLTNRDAGIYYNDKENASEALVGIFDANISFASEMIPGKTYLVFLEREVETETDQEIWLYHYGFMALRFCYEEIENHVCTPIFDSYHGAFYGDIKENEFFLESEESIQKMAVLKEKLLRQYPLDD